jgi:hypothetical protein
MKKIILTLSLLILSCNQDSKEKLVVYQSPSCGCCSGWVANMEQNGLNVEAIKTNDMYSTKVKAGIDVTLQSCHTGFIEGMETINEKANFDVLAVNADGSTFVWKHYE